MVLLFGVALYPLSSSNHNGGNNVVWSAFVALYPLSSSNHNWVGVIKLLFAVALYPLSSSNHNVSDADR